MSDCGNCGGCKEDKGGCAVLEKETTTKKAKREGAAPADLKAPLYRVILHNDDHNQFNAVVAILVQLFHFAVEEAFKLTKEAHEQGSVCVRVEMFEPAELHRDQLRTFGLTATMEKE